MKARTFIITAGAVLALVIPAAAGASLAQGSVIDRAVSGPSIGHHLLSANAQAAKIKAQAATIARQAATIRAQAAKIRSLTPVFVYDPGTRGPQTQTHSADDCSNYMVNCTDQQNCEIWGFNCDTYVPQVDSSTEHN